MRTKWQRHPLSPQLGWIYEQSSSSSYISIWELFTALGHPPDSNTIPLCSRATPQLSCHTGVGTRCGCHCSLHTHLAAILLGCLGWSSLLDSWLLASPQGAYGNFHEDDLNCSYLAYQEAQAIGINQLRKKNPISGRKKILLFACLGYLLLESL